MPVCVIHTGTDEKIKFAVKRKAEETSSHEKTSPVKMKFGACSNKGTSSGISIKLGQLVSFIFLYKNTYFMLFDIIFN